MVVGWVLGPMEQVATVGRQDLVTLVDTWLTVPKHAVLAERTALAEIQSARRPGRPAAKHGSHGGVLELDLQLVLRRGALVVHALRRERVLTLGELAGSPAEDSGRGLGRKRL